MRHRLVEYGVARPVVDGHSVTADAFRTPWVRRFEPGHDAGRWIVRPSDGEDGYEDQLRGAEHERSRAEAEMLADYRQRATRAKNRAKRLSKRRRRSAPLFTPEDRNAVDRAYEEGEAARRRGDRATAMGRYRDCIALFERLLAERQGLDVVSSLPDLEASRGAYRGDFPTEPPPPEEQPFDRTRWIKWLRALRHSIDFLNFEFSRMTTSQIHAYLDSLPELPAPGGRPAFERVLERAATEDPRTWHAWLWSERTASVGRYFGTIPGAERR